MNEAQERLLEDILSELKTFNDNYTSELERAENERNNQAVEDRNNAEILAEAEKQALELQDQQTQENLEKEEEQANIIKERFESIESLLENSEKSNKLLIQTLEESNRDLISSIEESNDLNESIEELKLAIFSNGEILESVNQNLETSLIQSNDQFSATGFVAGGVAIVSIAILVFCFLNWFFKPFFTF
ncbi:hypothetical protein [Enterococcus sp. N249-2]